MKPINRRQFLQIMGMGAVAASTTTYFDMGRKLYIPAPSYAPCSPIGFFPDSRLFCGYDFKHHGWRRITSNNGIIMLDGPVRFEKPQTSGVINALL